MLVCFKCKEYEKIICDLESKFKSVEDRNMRLADVNNQLSEKLKIFYENEKAHIKQIQTLQKANNKIKEE